MPDDIKETALDRIQWNKLSDIIDEKRSPAERGILACLDCLERYAPSYPEDVIQHIYRLLSKCRSKPNSPLCLKLSSLWHHSIKKATSYKGKWDEPRKTLKEFKKIDKSLIPHHKIISSFLTINLNNKMTEAQYCDAIAPFLDVCKSDLLKAITEINLSRPDAKVISSGLNNGYLKQHRDAYVVYRACELDYIKGLSAAFDDKTQEKRMEVMCKAANISAKDSIQIPMRWGKFFQFYNNSSNILDVLSTYAMIKDDPIKHLMEITQGPLYMVNLLIMCYLSKNYQTPFYLYTSDVVVNGDSFEVIVQTLSSMMSHETYAQTGISLSLPGHHAGKQAAGFCIFNFAVAQVILSHASITMNSKSKKTATAILGLDINWDNGIVELLQNLSLPRNSCLHLEVVASNVWPKPKRRELRPFDRDNYSYIPYDLSIYTYRNAEMPHPAITKMMNTLIEFIESNIRLGYKSINIIIPWGCDSHVNDKTFKGGSLETRLSYLDFAYVNDVINGIADRYNHNIKVRVVTEGGYDMKVLRRCIKKLSDDLVKRRRLSVSSKRQVCDVKQTVTTRLYDKEKLKRNRYDLAQYERVTPSSPTKKRARKIITKPTRQTAP